MTPLRTGQIWLVRCQVYRFRILRVWHSVEDPVYHCESHVTTHDGSTQVAYYKCQYDHEPVNGYWRRNDRVSDIDLITCLWEP